MDGTVDSAVRNHLWVAGGIFFLEIKRLRENAAGVC
jgi:hypothetical protein